MTSAPPHLPGLVFSLVGPGRVGSSLAHWLASAGGRLIYAAGRQEESTRVLTDDLGGQWRSVADLDTAGQDLLLIAVSDPALTEVSETLASRPHAAVVLHTSGRNTAAALAALRRPGTAIGSMHPLAAFSHVVQDPVNAQGTTFGIDGDPEAQALARRLAQAWQCTVVEIPPAARSLYHLAATMAAGGVVTLLASAVGLAERVGVDHEVARGFLHLAHGAIDGASRSASIPQAITGPLARGDVASYLSQVEEARALDPELANLLELLGKRTLLYRSQGPKATE